MKLLGIDFETTGLSFEKDRITEIGAVLWCTETAAPMQIFNVLVKHEDGPGITEEITRLTGITQAMLDAYGVAPDRAFARLIQMMLEADALVAHNGMGFDKPMLEAQIKRSKACRDALPPDWEPLWIDTCMDVPYPEAITTRKLVHLAAEHGFLNPFAHRAVFDVLTMLKVLERYPIEAVLESARQPMMTLQALVSFDDREKAKARGYRWKAETKQWLRNMKAHLVEKEMAECGFQVAVVEAP